MTKKKIMVYLDDEVSQRLDAIAGRYGTTQNSLLAIVGYELSRIAPENFWQVMGNIAAEQTRAIDEGEPRKALKTKPARRLPAAEVQVVQA